MRTTHPLEASIGMELYSTSTPGVGGRLKVRFEDFIVEEITADRRLVSVKEWSDKTPRLQIPEEKSKFIQFDAQKMGLSTIDIATIIAAELGLPQHLVTYAGLKDKRAITAQQMAVPFKSAERLVNAKLSRIQIRNLESVRHPVQIGDLWGNRFTIRLSNIDADCNQAMVSVNALTKLPLLNYFGVQRFGVTRPFTHLVGKALVQDDFEEATRLMLSVTSEYESEEIIKARRKLADDLIPNESILEAFPKNLRYERDVIKFLMKHPGEFERAVSRIPSRVLTIFVHAFQSYLFNRLISQRAESSLPLDLPVPGDFLMKLDEAHAGRDSWLFVTEKNCEERVKLVQSGEYGLSIPLPGYSTKTPPSVQTDMLRNLMLEEDVRFQDFRKPKRKAIDSAGGFHLLAIVLKDIRGECKEDDVVLHFQLRKGSYATVVMREIMKNDPINRV
ncbi:MAG: tRNA pseudouridine(13) synthase TruD [Candidatus Thorarchaeota archaeon]